MNFKKTCAACGRPFDETDIPNFETIIDSIIRQVMVHKGCSVFSHKKVGHNVRPNQAR